MKNSKNALMYGAIGAAGGFGVAHLMKLDSKKKLIVTLVLGAIGAYLGNNTPVEAASTMQTTTDTGNVATGS